MAIHNHHPINQSSAPPSERNQHICKHIKTNTHSLTHTHALTHTHTHTHLIYSWGMIKAARRMQTTTSQAKLQQEILC